MSKPKGFTARQLLRGRLPKDVTHKRVGCKCFSEVNAAVSSSSGHRLMADLTGKVVRPFVVAIKRGPRGRKDYRGVECPHCPWCGELYPGET